MSHFIDPLYASDHLDAAPFGSDEGADLLAEVELGHKTIDRDTSLFSFISQEDVDHYFAAAEDGDVDGLIEIYATAFLLLRFNGALQESDYQILRSALLRLSLEPEMERIELVVIPDLDSFMQRKFE